MVFEVGAQPNVKAGHRPGNRMLSFWVHKLSTTSGLPLRDASDVWSRHVLSGFRSWQPWACLAFAAAIYVLLRFGYIASISSRYAGVLATLAMVGGVFGTWWLASRDAFPRALAAALRKAAP